MDRIAEDRLDPGYAVPNNKSGKMWDSTIEAIRVQKLPIALSKSSVAANANAIMTGNGNTNASLSPSSSVSSYASMASSIASSHTTFTYSSASSTPPSLVSRPSNYSKQMKVRSRAPLRPVFHNLPPEIYDCILRQLRVFHEEERSQSCQTCYQRDLCSLSSTSRAWDKAVVKRLYDRIHIVGPDSKEQTKKHKMKTGVRLKLLRRTLRERSFLAQHVRELKIPRLQVDGAAVPEDMINIAASIIMACPNFERLVGFYPVYGHEFDRLTHALSTRTKLKEQVWLIGENAAITQRSHKQLAPGLMDAEQKGTFVSYHNAWSHLTTLLLHSPTLGILEKDIFVNLKKNSGHPNMVRGPGILNRLPSLRHLCISNFDMDDFDDVTLQHLPPLHSLRLQDLEGVTFWGLSEYSRTRNAFSLRSLSLVNLDITYISAISNLLLHLKNLKRFTLVQDTSPEVAEGEVVFQPLMANYQLEYLHWEIIVPGTANPNLRSSIRANGFPRLRTIRAPADHDGLLQALCKPRAQIELPSDWASPIDLRRLPPGSLRAARRDAQQRIEDAWSTVQFKILVEEAGVIHEIFDLNGFIGEIGSRITYSLEPDVLGSDMALVDFEDLMSPSVKEDGNGGGGKQSCRGLWNAKHSAGKPWWGHSERGRFKPIEAMSFF